uniref:50S ribosomal protein L18 n=1 Tax=Dictyotopsis propagulifera TaxID=670095 RepID=UPI002E79DD59|nr:50S ribosomal protein L18 [Dictyotopsis propagulifera]WAM63140.1 50S ribosomal protein L18 [Dictyotopsis propagulifera]
MAKREKKKIKGTRMRPRLSVHKSNNHIYAQVIDDSSAKTILSCSTLDLDIKSKCEKTSTKLASKLVGQILGTKLLSLNIKKIVFDRREKPYHGRIKELADGARFVGVIF